MAMEMQSVASSNIEAVGYDSDAQKLRVRFKGGKVYEYDDVPPDVVEGLVEAESPGSFFARVVRGGGFAYAQVNVEAEEDEDDADEAESDENDHEGDEEERPGSPSDDDGDRDGGDT